MVEVNAKNRSAIADEQRRKTAGPTLTRRTLLAGTGQLALLAMVPLGCAPAASLPFSDGTFWDDGSGWSA